MPPLSSKLGMLLLESWPLEDSDDGALMLDKGRAIELSISSLLELELKSSEGNDDVLIALAEVDDALGVEPEQAFKAPNTTIKAVILIINIVVFLVIIRPKLYVWRMRYWRYFGVAVLGECS